MFYCCFFQIRNVLKCHFFLALGNITDSPHNPCAIQRTIECIMWVLTRENELYIRVWIHWAWVYFSANTHLYSFAGTKYHFLYHNGFVSENALWHYHKSKVTKFALATVLADVHWCVFVDGWEKRMKHLYLVKSNCYRIYATFANIWIGEKIK